MPDSNPVGAEPLSDEDDGVNRFLIGTTEDITRRLAAKDAEVQRLRRVVDAAKRVRILHRGCQRNWLGTIHCTCGKRDLDNALAALTPTSEP